MHSELSEQLADHLPRLQRVAHRMVGRWDLACEVVQDACVKVLRKGDSFRADASLTTWLHRVVANTAKDALRAGQRRTAAVERYERLGLGQPAAVDPVEAVVRDELAAMAWEALAQIDDDCRSAFVLTQLDGYTYDEAAAIEGLPRGTIATRVARAKRQLLEMARLMSRGAVRSA